VLGGIEARSIRTVARRLDIDRGKGQLGVTNRRWGWSKGEGWGKERSALFYPGVGDKRVDHEVTVNDNDKASGR
jgi:hypothetical protein